MSHAIVLSTIMSENERLLFVAVLSYINCGFLWHKKKALSGRPGRVEFPSGQATFYSHSPDGQGISKSSTN